MSFAFMGGTAQAAQAHTHAKEAHQEYLDSTQTVGGSGSDQCGSELSKRIGNWVCPAPASTAPKAAAGTGYCEVSGYACRYRYDDFSADVGASGYWGWNGTMLGKVDVYASFQLAGAQTWSKPVSYTNSAATTNVIFTGDLINAAPGAQGSQVAGRSVSTTPVI